MRKLTRVTLVVAALVLILVSWHNVSSALCIQPEQEGNWVNVDPDTRGITTATLRFVCQDQILNGQPYPPGPPWYVHLKGSCSPQDCDWGEVGAQYLSSGYIYAFYDQGFAKRYVYFKMSQSHPGQLWMYMWTDFKDPKRKDYSMNGWFKKQ